MCYGLIVVISSCSKFCVNVDRGYLDEWIFTYYVLTSLFSNYSWHFHVYVL